MTAPLTMNASPASSGAAATPPNSNDAPPAKPRADAAGDRRTARTNPISKPGAPSPGGAQADGGEPDKADDAKKDVAPAPTWKPAGQSWVVVVIFALIIIAGVLVVLASWRLWPFTSADQQTENAYIKGDTTVISPQVSGYVKKTFVRDFAFVQAGQVLVTIDPSTYLQAVEQSKASLAQSRASLANSGQTLAQAYAQVRVNDAGVVNAKAQLALADITEARSNDLVTDGSLSQKEAEQNRAARAQAAAALLQAEATRDSAMQQVRSVEVNKEALTAAVAGSIAGLHSSEINLAHTVIRAPVSGQLGQVGVRQGAYVTSGTQLLYLVPPLLWVTANYKEAQTRQMAPNQSAWFAVDALGGARLRGHVERLSPATGSEFAVLPADNATGNFTKVPQRISVRMLVDPGQPLASRLRAGMSVEAHVDTSSGATNQPHSVPANR